MSELLEPNIPVEAVAAGRSFEDVLTAYMAFYERAKNINTTPGKSEENIFSDTLACTAYRIYLLGVEDGMNRREK